VLIKRKDFIDMKKLNIKNKRFVVVPEKKMVVGRMDRKPVVYGGSNCKPLHRELLKFACNAITWQNFDVFDGFGEYKAVAKCDNRDEFNEKVGIDICEEKLEMKKHLRIARVFDRVHRLLVETGMVAYQECVKHVNKANAIKEDLERMYGGDIDEG